jgi:CRISPR/Cas system-associated exonuclease Cas4 (RecB family)
MTWDNIWEESFNQAIADVETKTGTNPTDWRVSGTATLKNPNKEDKVWWDDNGKKMFFDFINVWQESQMEIWTSPQGVPGIEIEFNNNFGDVLIKAFADLVAILPTGEVAIIDFKTGKYTPDSAMQLGIYACAMEMTFGFRPTRGFYYSARKAQFIEVRGLDRWTIPIMTELFAQFTRGLDAEIFLPNVGMSCMSCGVKEYCYAVGGQLSTIYDPLAEIK